MEKIQKNILVSGIILIIIVTLILVSFLINIQRPLLGPPIEMRKANFDFLEREYTLGVNRPFVMNIDTENEENILYGDNSDLFDIDPNTGIISFTPSNADIGTHLVVIVVMDRDKNIEHRVILFRLGES